MEKIREIPWLRIGAESVAIVASILFAFAIDAWWEDRVERAEEQVHLATLHSEFEQTLELLQSHTIRFEEAEEATRLLLGLDAATVAGTGWGNFEGLLRQSIGPGRLNFPLGALEALIASGDLGMISDRELATKVAGWSSLNAEVYENETMLVENREGGIVPLLMEYGVTRSQFARRLSDYPSSRFEPRTDALFADPRFEGLLSTRANRIMTTIIRHRILAAETKNIVALIERNFED